MVKYNGPHVSAHDVERIGMEIEWMLRVYIVHEEFVGWL